MTLNPLDFYSPCDCNNDTVHRLVVQLNEAWAERDRWQKIAVESPFEDLWHQERDRAERAEEDWRVVSAVRDHYAAALDRVRALCDEATPPNQCRYADDGTDCESHCDCGWGTLWHGSVRAAIEGDNQ